MKRWSILAIIIIAALTHIGNEINKNAKSNQDNSGYKMNTSSLNSNNKTFDSSTKKYPPVSENGDIRGADNDGDGRPEPVFVRGYYKKDGTYVRSHYRALPRKRR